MAARLKLLSGRLIADDFTNQIFYA